MEVGGDQASEAQRNLWPGAGSRVLSASFPCLKGDGSALRFLSPKVRGVGRKAPDPGTKRKEPGDDSEGDISYPVAYTGNTKVHPH